MGAYRQTCADCGDTTETDSWEPEECPFCRVKELEQDNKEMLEAMHFPYMSTENDEFVLVRLEYIQKLDALIARMEGKG